MPRVGDKEFPYTEEGMAAAEAEAAGLDEAAVLDQILSEMPEEVPEEAEEAVEVEPEVVLPEGMPDEETVMAILEETFGEAFDEGSPEDVQKLEFILYTLASDPELAAAIASGEMSIAEFAIQLYRLMGGEDETPVEETAAAEPVPVGY